MRRRLEIALLELLFWTPFAAVPLLSLILTCGDPSLGRDIAVSSFITAVLAVATSSRFVIPLRVIAFAILAIGSGFITSIALLTHNGGDRMLMESILDTNSTEIASATKTYGALFHPAHLAIITPPIVALFLQYRRKRFWAPPKYSMLVLLALFVGQLAMRHQPGSWGPRSTINKIVEIFPYIYPVEAYPPFRPYVFLGEALVQRRSVVDFAENDLRVAAPASALPRTYVVVVGESLSKYHMGLYGYHRPTTNNLSDMAKRRELYVFDDMVTTHAQTVGALFAALTLTTGDGKRRTIFDVFNSAGFHTYWLSNQWQFSLHSFPNDSSMIAQLARHAREQVWLNSVDLIAQENFDKHLDERLLPPLERALADTTYRDKMIFLHLAGNHFNYDARYKEFVNFADAPPCATGDEARQIDDYDSSIVYNDSIVKRIIDAVKTVPGESFVLYLSDHGEEVFDFREHAGHLDAQLSPYMAEVPFMIWLSPAYEERHAELAAGLSEAVVRAASTVDLPNDLADLADLSFLGVDRTRSVFSRDFVRASRITAGQDYDTFKKLWKPDTDHASGYDLLSCTTSLAAR